MSAELAFPVGEYGLYADDDDVIGLTVARTYPNGWSIVRTEPPFMDAIDEFAVGNFLVWCMSNAVQLLRIMDQAA